jgi:hypothetical protein
VIGDCVSIGEQADIRLVQTRTQQLVDGFLQCVGNLKNPDNIAKLSVFLVGWHRMTPRLSLRRIASIGKLVFF